MGLAESRNDDSRNVLATSNNNALWLPPSHELRNPTRQGTSANDGDAPGLHAVRRSSGDSSGSRELWSASPAGQSGTSTDLGVAVNTRGNRAGTGNAFLVWTVTTAALPSTTVSQPLALAPQQPTATTSQSFSSIMTSSTSTITSTYLPSHTPWSNPPPGTGSGGSGAGWWWSGDNSGGSNSSISLTSTFSSMTPAPTPTDSNLSPTSVIHSPSTSPTATSFPNGTEGEFSGSTPASPSPNLPAPPRGSATLDSATAGLPPSAVATLIAFPVSLALMLSAMVALIIVRRRHGSHYGMHRDDDLEAGSRSGPPAPPRPPSIVPLNREEHQQFLHQIGPAAPVPPRMSSAPPLGSATNSFRQPRPHDSATCTSFGASASSQSGAFPLPMRPRSPKGRPVPHHRHSVAIPMAQHGPRVLYPASNRHSHHRLSTPVAISGTKPMVSHSPYRASQGASPSAPSRPPTSHASRSPRPHPSIILNNLTSSASVSEQAARRISGLGAIPRRPSSLSLSVISRADLEAEWMHGSDDGSDHEEFHNAPDAYLGRQIGEDRVSTFEFEQLTADAEGRPRQRRSSFFWFT